MAGSIGFKEENLFKEMLVVDSLRGTDSTGIAAIGRWDVTQVSKAAGDPFQLFETNHFKEALRQKNKVLIGHNRAATTGKINRANAHPFDFETLVGVHNGTLRNKHMLEDSHKFDTDSEALYHNIEKNGLQAAIDKASGAYALVWWDKEEKTLNFLRNKERPMSFVFSEDRKLLFYASEPWMITCILGRAGIKTSKPEVLPEDSHFSFQIPEDGKEFEKAKVRQVVPAPFQITGGKEVKKTSTVSVVSIKDHAGVFHPKAEEIIALFRKKEKENTGRSLVIGSRVEGYTKTWGQDEHGTYYVNLLVVGHMDEEFRCYVRNKQEATDMMCHMYFGTISKMRFDKKRIYNLAPDSMSRRFQNGKDTSVSVITTPTLPTAEIIDFVIEDKKKDHEGKLIDQKEFDSRYSNCSWCSSPLLFDEDWEAFSRTDAVCGSCMNDTEVKKYLDHKSIGAC